MDNTEKKYLDSLINDGIDSENYTVVTWPESQHFIGDDECTLINDDVGYELYGDSAYIVPRDKI